MNNPVERNSPNNIDYTSESKSSLRKTNQKIRIVIHAATFAAAALISGCALLPQSCMAPSRVMASAEIIFGRNIGDRPGVSEAAFANFVAREITPRFPEGVTVIDGNGQWQDPARGTAVRERSKVVLVIFTDDAQKRVDLVSIADNYKREFSQQSVLTLIRNACVSF